MKAGWGPMRVNGGGQCYCTKDRLAGGSLTFRGRRLPWNMWIKKNVYPLPLTRESTHRCNMCCTSAVYTPRCLGSDCHPNRALICLRYSSKTHVQVGMVGVVSFCLSLVVTARPHQRGVSSSRDLTVLCLALPCSEGHLSIVMSGPFVFWIRCASVLAPSARVTTCSRIME